MACLARTTCRLLLIGALSCTAEEPAYQHGISLLHELKYPADFEHFEYANANAPKGGRIVFSTTANIVNFNSVPGMGVPKAVGLGRTIDRLLIRSADELSGLYGQLAEGVALAADRKSLAIRLHAHARWHDGVPLTTRDVQFSYREMQKTSFGKVYLEPWIESLEIVGPQELVVHHRGKFVNSNLVALSWFPIRPAHYWADKDPSKTTLVPPVASGPYRVAAFDRSYVRYERVDDYWGRDLPVNRGRYNFDEIRYEVYRDATVAREAFRKGIFDLYFETDIKHWFASYDLPALHQGWLRKDTRTVKKFIGPQVAIALNTAREPLSDVRVREALFLAMDFEWQNRVFRRGSQSRADSYFATSRFAATGLPQGDELKLLNPFRDRVPKRVFVEEIQMPVSRGFGINRQALERARALLAEAGWEVYDGRLLDRDGNPFSLQLLTQNQAMQRVLLPYAESLALLGIDARVRLVDNTTAINLMRERNFDAYVRGHDTLNPPIGELRNLFASRSADIELSGNVTSIRDPVVDALIEQAEQATTLAAATAACRALDRVLLWGFYHIPLNVPDVERFLFWDKFGRPDREAVAEYEYLTGSALRILDSWWFDADKASRLPVGDG